MAILDYLTDLPGAIFKAISAPIIDRALDSLDVYFKAGVDKNKIKADLEAALAGACVEIAETQADVLKVALTQGSTAERNWRAWFMIACGFTLIWYGLITPVLVAWLGAPAPIVGDKLLEWIYLLCAGGVAGYAGGPPAMKFAERIVAAVKRK